MRIVKVDFSGEIIFGKYLEKFVDFCFQISDRVELVDNHSDRITYKEYELAKQEIDSYYCEKGMELLEEFNEQDISEIFRKSGETEEQIQEYINQYRRKNTPSLRYTCTTLEIQQYLQNFQKFNLMKRQVTNKTHCTISDAAVVYTFGLEENLKACFLEMEEIFQPVYVCEDGFCLDDPAFYQEGRLIVAICSHERYGTMYLTEEEYEHFKEYQIPHLIEEDRWWLEEQADSLETIFVIIEERAMLGGLLGPSYTMDEFPTWENRLKIYRQYKHLPPIRYVSAETILMKLSETYGLDRFYSDEIEDQIMTNIKCNQCLARYLKNKNEMLIELYQIEYKNKKLFIGVEKTSGYIVVDTFETLDKIHQLRKKQMNEQRKHIYSFVFFDSENKEQLYPKECEMLCDEISLIRGLDEFEQKKVECVNYYDKIKRRVQSKGF